VPKSRILLRDDIAAMKLEYIADNTDGGKYPDAWPRRLIRLFDFDEQQNQQLISLLFEQLLGQHADVELADVAFITPLNCRLTFRLSAVDTGIVALNSPNSFACHLSKASYREAIAYMQSVGDGHQWLSDTSASVIELLYSAGGTW
jgi:hypothetical protein